ncbi:MULTISPECIES: hypothetical protein [Calothrix]|uniref:Uncharacterized protein n=2 Tax=Calothrix TaxID=1186 RepID=A0ABR8AA26_9CYAN|nr:MULTISPECIES: hypothetical protein [Calothrix]MBD2196851.1 hypothetical protein [Calothrix parietina FACHB-288]MBD2225479.1 hypothetical protein [Calothrix anomala FACHB-343]
MPHSPCPKTPIRGWSFLFDDWRSHSESYLGLTHKTTKVEFIHERYARIRFAIASCVSPITAQPQI